MTAAKKKGFTLIELLVVIAIIAMLSSVVLAALSSARMKARDARRKADLTQIQIALNLYYDAYGVYPPYRVSNTCGGARADFATSACTLDNWVTTDANFLNYIAKPPKDSINKNAIDPAPGRADSPWWGASVYAYTTSKGGQDYDLVTHLENVADPDRCELRKYLGTIDHDGASPDNGVTTLCWSTVGGANWLTGQPFYVYSLK
jgi:prepilin-type N-terminal cleavage/methylation domain-containing protein